MPGTSVVAHIQPGRVAILRTFLLHGPCLAAQWYDPRAGERVSHERVLRDGKPDWDLDVIAGPRGALLFALDLAYEPNGVERVFHFGPPPESAFLFRLPCYASKAVKVFRVDADGAETIEHTMQDGLLAIRDRVSRVAVHVVASAAGERERIEARRQALIAEENAFGFDAGRNPADLTALEQLLEQ